MVKRRVSAVLLGLLAALGIAQPALADDVVNGRIGPGAIYRLVRPTAWNGRLVLYAHGYVSPDEPVAIPPDAEVVIGLLTSYGFGVAASSFSENGWAVKDGTLRTYQLLDIFRSKFGNPIRVYTAGGSMGGLIAIRLAETYPSEFSGVLPACPVAGGLRAQVDYMANVRVLFDLFYPNILPGSVVDVPEGLDVASQIVAPAVAVMTFNPTGAGAIASITQTPVPFADGAELVQSIALALAGAAGYPDILRLTHGQPVFDNMSTQYTGALPPGDLQLINATVERYSASAAGLNYLDHNYTPTGNLVMPALTLSTFRDPVAPGFHLSAYGAVVAAAGNSHLLVQRLVPGTGNGYGHCTFTEQELVTAFLDLVLWAELGLKPAN